MQNPDKTLLVFAHVTAPLAAFYRAVLSGFRAAKSQFVLHLRPEDILVSLPELGFHNKPPVENGREAGALDREFVDHLLKSLWEWGNLRAYQDTAEVATVEEFMRKRFLYQLTPEGEAAESALQVFEELLSKPGELQATALEDISLQLSALMKLAAEDEPDPARTSSVLGELRRRFEDLTSQAQRFMGGLQRHIDLYQVEVETFLAYKEMLLDYLDRFIHELVVATSAITAKLQELESQIQRLLDLAAERELKDAFNPDQRQREERREQWRARWQGLCGWFIGSANRSSQAEVLRTRALQAIPDLLSVVATINERRTTRGDRMADLRALARWFMECDQDRDAHRLWRAAFGLHPSRHLRINAETLAVWDEVQPAPSTSWLDAPSLQISPRLRQYGSTQHRGRRSAIIDRTLEKKHLADLAAREASQLARARARLAGNRPILLSHLHVLEPLEFQLFFDLLARALSWKRHAGDPVCTTSADGTLEMKLDPLPEPAQVVVRTALGTLTLYDHRITIRDLFADQTASMPGYSQREVG